MNTARTQRLEDLAPAVRGGDVEPGVHDEQGGRGRGRELHPRVHPEGHVGGADDGEHQEDVEPDPGRPVVTIELALGQGDGQVDDPGQQDRRPPPCTARPSGGPAPTSGNVIARRNRGGAVLGSQGRPVRGGRARTGSRPGACGPPPDGQVNGSRRAATPLEGGHLQRLLGGHPDHRGDAVPVAVGVRAPTTGCRRPG